MDSINTKAWYVAKKNVKEKLKNYGSMFWTIFFPIMMLIVYKLVFTDDGNNDGTELINGLTVFDLEFPGIVVYTIGISTLTSAVMFSVSKKNGTLERLDSMPVGRGNIFLGAVLSETIFMNLQLVLVFGFGYGILGAYFEPTMFFLGYIIAMIYGIGAIGLGLIIASFTNSPEAANGIGMMTHMILMFTSGSFFPFESPCVYFTPQFWVKQVYLQSTVLGHSFSDKLYSGSMIGYSSDPISITILGGIFIIIFFTMTFIFIGLMLFQKKTKL